MKFCSWEYIRIKDITSLTDKVNQDIMNVCVLKIRVTTTHRRGNAMRISKLTKIHVCAPVK
jgi:hypothetical protein